MNSAQMIQNTYSVPYLELYLCLIYMQAGMWYFKSSEQVK